MNNKLMLYTVLIYTNFIFWGIIQEKLYDLNVLTKYNNLILVATNAMSLVIIAPNKQQLIHLVKLISVKKNMKFFLILLITQTLTQPLNYFITSKFKINYLFLQLSKSCKMIPVIFIHKFIYGMSIKKSKIVISLMITVSIIVFNYRPKGSKNIGASISSLLLLIPLAMEGFTNTSQDQLFALNKLYKITSNDLLFYNNFINVIVHAGYLILFDRDQVTSFMNDKIVWSGSYQIAIQLFLYAALQIIGTNLIFKVLYQFDSLALLRITILRKVTSLLISCIFMSEGKQFSKYEITGLAGVIGSLLLEFYLKKNQSRGDIKKVSIVKTNFKIPDLRSKKTH
ncbi:hypothetical protein QEN19_000471 [Hanseniaspora menglaensis]